MQDKRFIYLKTNNWKKWTKPIFNKKWWMQQDMT